MRYVLLFNSTNVTETRPNAWSSLQFIVYIIHQCLFE